MYKISKVKDEIFEALEERKRIEVLDIEKKLRDEYQHKIDKLEKEAEF